MNKISLLLIILITSISCKSAYKNFKNEAVKIDSSKNLYAFIGVKISVIEFDPNNPIVERLEIDSITKDTVRYESFVMDNAFNCKYVIEQNLLNKIENDTIEFKAYNHYGRPSFENYDKVLLYLSKDKDGNYYHQKYQYDPLFRNSKGRYYSYPKFYGYSYLEVANELETFEIKFPKSEKYNTKDIGVKGEYYQIKGKYAYPVKGMFLDEIIEFRLRTIFKNL